ncbi:hypothetical protein CJU89_2823 [Yarrowia sp. B02]|nr:hypothetical protein CJU89_2823 [Yarrowia sp. B02]
MFRTLQSLKTARIPVIQARHITVGTANPRYHVHLLDNDTTDKFRQKFSHVRDVDSITATVSLSPDPLAVFCASTSINPIKQTLLDDKESPLRHTIYRPDADEDHVHKETRIYSLKEFQTLYGQDSVTDADCLSNLYCDPRVFDKGNPEFLKVLNEVLKKDAYKDPQVKDFAAGQVFSILPPQKRKKDSTPGGTLYIPVFDNRNPPMQARVPDVQDTMGMIVVNYEGVIDPNTYEENFQYRIITPDGPPQLSDYIYPKVKKVCEEAK